MLSIYKHLKIMTPKMMREDAMFVKSDMTPGLTFSYKNWKSSEVTLCSNFLRNNRKMI